MPEENFEERVVTVPLWKTYKTGKYRRTKKALSVLKEEISKILKDNEFIIDSKVNEELWSRGIKNPKRRLSVKIKKLEDGKIIITLP
ncbi:MAG: 50S ribosomal protein L31e [Nitrososphaeria archaeon]